MKKFLKFFLSIIRSYGDSLLEAVRENEYTQEFKERYPRFFRFVACRLSPREYLGLHLTIGFFIALYLTVQFIDLVSAIARNTELAQIDANFITFLTTVRTGQLMRQMLFFTALGNWPAIALFFLFFTTLWLRQKRWFLVWMFFLTVAGSEFLSVLLKIFIARGRPDPAAALFLETSYSFPSGHALLALSFYGFIAYVLARERRHILSRVAIVLSAAVLIICIGVSRIYLGVHWPSDVVGGYLLALIWLVIIATAADVRRRFMEERVYHEKTLFPFQWALPFFILFLAGALTYVVSFVERPHFSPSSAHRHIALPGEQHAAFNQSILNELPDVSEGLTGRTLEPISVLLIGEEAEMRDALADAGWFPAEVITLHSSWETFMRNVWNRPYPTAPVSPAFVYGRPQDMAWQKPTESNSSRERHHVRLWQSPYIVEGETLWLGTASFDAGVKLTSRSFPTHRIAPAIDVERDFFAADLERVGAVARQETLQRYDPSLGTNSLGDQFFTDGKVVIMYLK